jgi:arsenite methyltransferase
MSAKEYDVVRQNVRAAYTQVAEADNAGCGCGVPTSCCGTSPDLVGFSIRLGYAENDLIGVPEGADMGLGCGNPRAIASLQPGETVLDLGSGGGFDCFLAAREVRDSGHVIGVDMTPEMISKARANAEKVGAKNVEFRLGEIEYLPVADVSIDVIMSNCVINLSPNKGQVFHEAFRVLRPGGRLAISDVVAGCELPDRIKEDPELYSACVSGASSIDELETYLREAGFEYIFIEPKEESREFIKEWAPGRDVEDYVVSAYIQAVKPA